ncbi:MAG: hypothetical protein QXU92_04560 [Candidatus Diapherotrites archaeon]
MKKRTPKQVRPQKNPFRKNPQQRPKILTYEEFTKKGPNGIPVANNFLLHFVYLPGTIPNYRQRPQMQYLLNVNPTLANKLTQIITNYYRQNQGRINAQEIFEQTQQLLYQAYIEMKKGGFSDEELFR